MDNIIWLREIGAQKEISLALMQAITQAGLQIVHGESATKSKHVLLLSYIEDRETISATLHAILESLPQGKELWLMAPGLNNKRPITKSKYVRLLIPITWDVNHLADRVIAEAAIHLTDEELTFYGIRRFSAPMKKLCARIEKISKLKEPVLIMGPTGSGKGIVAQVLHDVSGLPGKLFKVNSTEVHSQLLAGELFGHLKGAFTDAKTDRVGLIQATGEGNFFLDEIGDMEKELQAKILSVIEDRRVRRMGSNTYEPIHARLIFSTNIDLQKAIANGDFREDLYQRLRVYLLHIPPLNERRTDILMLANFFLKNFNDEYNRNLQFSDRAHNALFAHDWPGNVRELRSVVYQAAGFSETDGAVSDVELLDALGESKRSASQGPDITFNATQESWEEVQAKLKNAYFYKLITSTKSNKEAMVISGLSKARFYQIKKDLGL